MSTSILSALYSGPSGEAAVNYACGLAAHLGIPLRVVNPFTVPIALGEMPMPMLPVEEVRTSAERQLNDAIGKLALIYPSVEIKPIVTYGALSDVLDEEVSNSSPLLTVVSHDEGEDPEIWLASDTADLLREGKGAILVVTRSAVFAQPQHICLACDSQGIREGLPVDGLLQLQQALGFKITVLHVVAAAEETISFPSSQLSQQLNAGPVSYAEISAQGEVDEAIASFADTHAIDWLAVAPHHYGFWQGLFHKSHTSRILHLAHIPVLGLHE
jgi:nucleotide-binding universal stress UspA family protein